MAAVKQKFSEMYLEEVNKRLDEVMFEEPGPRDWTQVSLSIRDAMLATATVFGSSTDEQKHNLYRLLFEIIHDYYIPNLSKYDITVTEKPDNDEKA